MSADLDDLVDAVVLWHFEIVLLRNSRRNEPGVDILAAAWSESSGSTHLPPIK